MRKLPLIYVIDSLYMIRGKLTTCDAPKLLPSLETFAITRREELLKPDAAKKFNQTVSVVYLILSEQNM